MARIRSINPCQPKDEDVARLSITARYVFAFLPCHADREGRLRDSAFTLKAEILPGDASDMEAILVELAGAGFIIRYSVGSRRYIQIRTFLQHQSPHTREVPSTIPPPSAKDGIGQVQGSVEASPALGQASPGLEGMSPSPSIPDLDPSPDLPLSSPHSLLDQTRAGAESKTPAKWPAREWLRIFGLAWIGKYGGLAYGGGDATARACGQLRDILDALPEPDALAAQARVVDMLTEFLADETPKVVAARHPFAFFVTAFTGLRVPKVQTKKPDAAPPWKTAEREQEQRKLADRAASRNAVAELNAKLEASG